MKLIPRKRGRHRPEEAEGNVAVIKAQAEEWVAQTSRGFAETRAKLLAELESARASLARERERRTELERALESERQQRAELQRRLEEASAQGSEQRGRPKRIDRTPPENETAGKPGVGRVRKWEAVKALAAEGLSQREIAVRLGINRRTVARLIAADEPPRYRRRPQGSMLDPLEPVMRSVLRERPDIDAASMTDALREHGYRGSVDLVRRRLRALRPPS
jgi:transposase